MKEHDVTEQAFKNGYEKGKQEVAREIFEELGEVFLTIPLKDGEKATLVDFKRYAELKKKYIGE